MSVSKREEETDSRFERNCRMINTFPVSAAVLRARVCSRLHAAKNHSKWLAIYQSFIIFPIMKPLALSSAFKICVLCMIIWRWMALSSSDMYNKQMLITFKTYFMVMQIFMEVNCIIANFPQAQWREKVWLHSAQMISAICNRSKNTLLLISQVRLFLSKRYFIMIINTWSAGVKVTFSVTNGSMH